MRSWLYYFRVCAVHLTHMNYNIYIRQKAIIELERRHMLIFICLPDDLLALIWM